MRIRDLLYLAYLNTRISKRAVTVRRIGLASLLAAAAGAGVAGTVFSMWFIKRKWPVIKEQAENAAGSIKDTMQDQTTAVQDAADRTMEKVGNVVDHTREKVAEGKRNGIDRYEAFKQDIHEKAETIVDAIHK